MLIELPRQCTRQLSHHHGKIVTPSLLKKEGVTDQCNRSVHRDMLVFFSVAAPAAMLASVPAQPFKRFEGWLNSFHHVGDLRHLLVAHRTPWDLYAWLLRHTTALWRDATELRVHTKCTPSPPCKECLHHQSQTTCALHTKLRVRRGGTRVNCAACRCVATMANGTSVGESPGRCLWNDRIGNADTTISSCAVESDSI